MKKFFAVFLLLSIFSCAIPLTLKASIPADEELTTPDSALPKIIDFGSHQCKACKAMEPVLDSLTKKYAAKFKTEFIDVWKEENRALAEENKIESIPTQIFFSAEGKELFRNTGFFSEEDILAKWAELGYQF